MKPLSVEIWSDIACPWCWVGKRRLEEALASFEGDVDLRWRAFELDPTAPDSAPEEVDYAERLAAKYGTPRKGAEEMIDRMVGVGRECGIEMRFDRIRPSNTFDAHRLLAWARDEGLQEPLTERLFLAYLHEGRSVSDRETLVELASDVGLDPQEAGAILDGDRWSEEVRDDERSAAGLGVSGVPFFVLDRRLAVSGAQPASVLLEALRRAVGTSSSGS